jgi:hypothetical protein
MKLKSLALMTIVMLLISSCSTMVRIDTPDVRGATVRLDGEKLGTAPIEKKLSNGIWNQYDVVIEKDGYRTYRAPLRKEVKVGNLIGGILLFWPGLLWVYGPQASQTIELEPVK